MTTQWDLSEWLESGQYLPPVIRDFHECKYVFKTMHELVDVEKHGYCGDVDWIKGQCYVVDIFLWFMAKRGYTLQRSRKRLPYADLGEDVAANRERSAQMLGEILRADRKQANGSDPQGIFMRCTEVTG